MTSASDLAGWVECDNGLLGVASMLDLVGRVHNGDGRVEELWHYGMESVISGC